MLSNAVRLGSSMLMTRLLVPEMFGVMAIATLVMMGLTMFSDIGLRQNIIQSRRGSDPAYLNTAWAIQIIRGLLLWLLALCVSILVIAANRFGLVPKASVYADASLPYVIALVSISSVISGFQSTKLSEASRRLSLGRVTQIQIAAQILGLICMVGWVLIDRSIWALVAGSIFSTVVTTLLSHIWLPGVTNRWQWEPSAFHEIIHFGKWMFISSILGFVANNADRILLGGLVDSVTLGIYSIAFTIFSVASQFLVKIINDVGFPAVSEVARTRPAMLKLSYYKFYAVIASGSYLCTGFLIFSGENLIKLLYDRRYEQGGWMLEVLAVALPTIPFNLAYYCFLALGSPRTFTNIIALRSAATIVFIPLGFHFFGIPGAVWGIVASYYSVLPVVIYIQVKRGIFDLAKELLLVAALVPGMLLAGGFDLLLRN